MVNQKGRRLGQIDKNESDSILSINAAGVPNNKTLDAITEIAHAHPDRVCWSVLAAASLIAGHITPAQALAVAAGTD